MSETDKQLVSLSKAQRALAEAKTFDDVKEVMITAELFQIWAKKERLGIDIQNDGAEITLRCQRKIGGWLKEIEKNKGAAQKQTRGRDVPALEPPKLSEMGIEKHQSKRWQKVASVPEKQFEKIIEETKENKGKLCTASVLKPANDAAKEEKKRKAAKELKAKPLPTPKGKFDVIAIDPPWRYDDEPMNNGHRARNPYPDMTMDEIRALPVAKHAEKDCILWLWTTNTFMREAFTCLDAWGFTHKTILTWDKVNMGLGDWLRNSTEHCILAVRGKPTILLKNQTTLIREKRTSHSKKPDAFYDLVEALCPGTKLEMFARTPRENWQQWGNEV